MRAAVIKRPGVIEVEEVPEPAPGEGEVLLKVEASALCGTDKRVLSGEKHVDVAIVGHEVAGSVADVGPGVEGVAAGERYAVQTVIGCGRCPMCAIHRENLCEKGFDAIGYQYDGGFADYMVMPKVAVDQGCLIPIPDDMAPEIGTLIEPLSCCINGMEYIPLEGAGHVVILGAGVIGVLNGLVARARGAKEVTIVNRSQGRLDLLQRLRLPFDNYVSMESLNPEEWVREKTHGRGVDAVVVAASVKSFVPLGLKLVRRAGHISLFAGMPKLDPLEPIDLNRIHYLELNIHGANSSALEEYIAARDYLASGAIDGRPLITHRFSLADFGEAVKTQNDPAIGSLKIVIVP